MRLGVFGQAGSWYVNCLCEAGRRRGHEVQALHFEQFRSEIGTASADWYCEAVSLRTLDAILVRTMPPGTLEQVVARMDLLAGLESAGVRIINSPRSLECAIDKYLTTQRLSRAGLPVPRTVVCETAEAAMAAFERLERDVVVKPLFGAEGRGIVRVSDPELALRAFRTLERLGAVLYVQEFLSGTGADLRLLMLDGRLLGAMRRTPGAGDFRSNLAQQGTAVPCVPRPDELSLARAAAEAVGCLFGGVDLMYDAAGQPVIIEVNAVPGWKGLQQVCGVDVPDALLQWIEETQA